MDAISMAIASLGAAKDMAKGYLALKDEIGSQQLLIDLQAKIIEAQGSAMDAREAHQAMAREIENLKAEIVRASDQRATIAKMTRQQGVYFADEDKEPYCPRCIEIDLRLVHLSRSVSPGRLENWKCWGCKSTY